MWRVIVFGVSVLTAVSAQTLTPMVSFIGNWAGSGIRVVTSGTRMTFVDPAGDRWELALTDDLLTGTVTWLPPVDGGPGESLTVGFTYLPPLKPWDVPRTRLTGKVTLSRVGG